MNFNHYFLSVISFLLLQIQAYGQTQRCGTHEVYLENTSNFPEYGTLVNSSYNQAIQWAETNGFQRSGGVYQIPVVVHIVYTSPEQNLPDSVIHSQIDVLNEDFRRLNADTINTRSEFLPIAADAEIEFFLATTDPDGNPTNGITRTSGTPSGFGTYTPFDDNVKFDSLGGKNAWPTNRYLNIWVCDILFGFGILGYAYPPIGNVPNWDPGVAPADPNKQGVVIHWTVFGRNNPNSTGFYDIIDKGRTTTHEVAHYLGLRHIWGDGDCTVDDGVSDTPDAIDNAGQVCDWMKNTCTESSGPELPDNIENYMDYAADSCMNMFTLGQVSIMRYVIENFRPELVGLPASLNNYSVSNEVNLFPNPMNDILNIQIHSEKILPSSISIQDLTGRTIFSITENLYQISTHDLTPGTYIAVIKTNHGYISKRIIKN